jgi:hypothetical protein
VGLVPPFAGRIFSIWRPLLGLELWITKVRSVEVRAEICQGSIFNVALHYLLAEYGGLKGLHLHPGAKTWLKLVHGGPEGAASLNDSWSRAFDTDWRWRVDGQGYWGLVQVKAVMAWSVVLASMAGLAWNDEVELG